jgi:hypothetical protein
MGGATVEEATVALVQVPRASRDESVVRSGQAHAVFVVVVAVE